jgi:hypothetical protein
MDFFSVICLDAADMDGCRCTQQERMINVVVEILTVFQLKLFAVIG